MFANRISYWLGATGPSYVIDTGCSSSLYAFEHAYRAIREEVCDAALVGGANLCLHPNISMQFFKLGKDLYAHVYNMMCNFYFCVLFLIFKVILTISPAN